MLFRDVLVDSQLKQQLLNQVHEQRISHAQFFLAQPGSHAFALAVALAQYLCCENPQEDDSCGICPSCIQFEKLSHPDLHLYFPNCTTNSIKKDPDSMQLSPLFKEFVQEHHYHIELHDWLAKLDGENKQASINIRDCNHIINQNSIRSYLGGYKIYILWTVDRLYHAAAPKLLKTLEEPENRSLFILISEQPDKIINTILSRTQLVKIPRLSDVQVAQELKKEYPNLTADIAQDIAILAEGDYNKAEQIHLDNSEVKEMLNTFDLLLSSAAAMTGKIPNAPVQYANVQSAIGNIISQGREVQKQFLNFALRMLRNILMQNTNHLDRVKATATELVTIEKYKGIMNLKQVGQMTDELNRAIYHIERNGNATIIFTDVYLKIVNIFQARKI